MLRMLSDVDNVVLFQKYCGLSWENKHGHDQQQESEESDNQDISFVTKEGVKVNKENNNYKSSNKNFNGVNGKWKYKNDDPSTTVPPYKCNSFIHKIFEIGSELGNEIFYITFLPFVYWNIDEYIARRLVLLWVFTMYAGQALKDVLCWPRPASPPVLRLELDYLNEYGMPSTHAIAGSIIPFGLVYFSYERFDYNLAYGIAFFVFWTTLVCLSRVYRGMHTFQDLLAGLSVGAFVTALWLPYLDVSLEMFLSKPNAWIFILLIPILMIYVFPTRSMVTRNDTATIIAVGCGCMFGAWIDFYIEGIPLPDPYGGEVRPFGSTDIVAWTLFSATRFIIGIAVLIPIKIILKFLINNIAVITLSATDKVSGRHANNSLTLPYYFITYGSIGFAAVYVVPRVFDLVGLIV